MSAMARLDILAGLTAAAVIVPDRSPTPPHTPHDERIVA